MALLSDVLVVNAGSTSLKLSLVDDTTGRRPVASLAPHAASTAVGHRVVHGGERFTEPTLIDDGVVTELRALVELAPLHNAPALAAIEDARTELPDLPHIAVFDTAFHRTIPEVARTYALPRRFRDRGSVASAFTASPSRGRPSASRSRVSSSAISAAACP